MEGSVPLPLDPLPPPAADDKRLWIGNLDSRLTEYHLIKVLQKYGIVRKFDFLFHKSGPQRGQPRGYCFVTFETREQAERAIRALDGKPALSKKIAVKWAHTVGSEELEPKKPSTLASHIPDEPKSTKSVKNQISAIEAKLKAMENDEDYELERCLSATTSTKGSWQSIQPPAVHPFHFKPYNRPDRRQRASQKR